MKFVVIYLQDLCFEPFPDCCSFVSLTFDSSYAARFAATLESAALEFVTVVEIPADNPVKAANPAKVGEIGKIPPIPFLEKLISREFP